MSEQIPLFIQVGTNYFRSVEADLRKAAAIFIGKNLTVIHIAH